MNVVYFNAEKFYRLSYDYFYYESNLRLAKKYVNKALKNNINHFKSLFLKGQILLVENKTKNAIEYLLKAYKLNPNDPDCISYIASAYNLSGNYRLAYKYLNKIFKFQTLNKNFLSECYRLKVNLLISLNEYKQAKDTLKTLNKELYSNDAFDIEETFYNSIKKFKQTNDVIFHVNF